jgi:branched-chain amino acid transport system substrate-binding protein
MFRTRNWAIASTAVLLVAMAGCTEESAAGGGSGSAGDGTFEEVSGDINLVMVAPETGPLAATVGAALKAGTEAITGMWNDEHPDRQVQVTVCNDEGNPERAIACVNRYSADADVMIGPLFGAQYNAAEGLMGQQQIAITFTPHALPDASTNIFQTATPAHLATEHVVQYFQDQGWERFGMMTSTDTTGTAAREAAIDAAEEAGVEIVDQQFDPTSQDLTAQASSIADADVDAVFIWSSGAQVVTALRGLDAAGVDVPVVLNFSSMSYQLMGLASSVLPEELLFTGSAPFESDALEDTERRDMIQQFDERYAEASGGQKPDWIAYGTADMYTVALTAALHGEDVATMSAYLEQGDPIKGFHAVWDYSEDDHVGVSAEDGESPIIVQRWTGDGWESAE